MKWAFIIFLLGYSLGGATIFAAENGGSCAIESSMAIRSLGADIGTVSARTAGTGTDSDLQADVEVHVGWWFLAFTLKSNETASIRGGKLVAYRKTIDTGGRRKEIKGELNGDNLTILIHDRGKTEHKTFQVLSYDSTNLEYPEVTLTAGEVRKLRVIDLENAEAVDREYRHIAEEQMIICGRNTRVVVSDTSDKYAEYRRWTAVVNGVPVVIRQEGKEKTGLFNPSYSVRQTKVGVVTAG